MSVRPRRADAVRNRELILLTASELLATKENRPTVQTIAAKAGVSTATIYRSFATKHQLYAAAYARCMCDEIAPTMFTLTHGDLKPVEGLKQLARAQVTIAAGWITELSDIPGWIDEFVAEFLRRFEDEVNQIMVQAQALETLRPDMVKEDISGVTYLFLGGLAQQVQPIERANRYIDLWFDAVALR